MKASQLKAIAKQRIAGKTGTLIGAALIYFAILFGLFFIISFVYAAHIISKGVFTSVDSVEAYLKSLEDISNLTYFATDLATIVLGALVQTLSAGFMYMCLNVARMKETQISDLFYTYKRNPDRVILIALIQSGSVYLCMLIPTLIDRYGNTDNIGIALIYYVLYIVCSVLQIIVNILLSQSMFLYIDNPEESVITCVQVSIKIMRKNVVKYFGLSLSFIGWLLLSAISCGVAFLFVMPYMTVTLALFYLQLKGELGSKVDVWVDDRNNVTDGELRG